MKVLESCPRTQHNALKCPWPALKTRLLDHKSICATFFSPYQCRVSPWNKCQFWQIFEEALEEFLSNQKLAQAFTSTPNSKQLRQQLRHVA